MKINKYVCDKCKKEADKSISVDIPIDKEIDASGNGYNTNYLHLDFCENCIKKLLIKNYFNESLL